MRAIRKRTGGLGREPRRAARCLFGCEMLERREMLAATPAGDANYDNQFDADDIVLVLQAAKYQTGEPATFRQGDWNGDGLFDSADLTLASQEANYGKGQIDPAPTPPKNVIVIIGDGMGFEHVKAASLYLGEKLSFEEFPFRNQMATSIAGGPKSLVDSASGGTAIATGVKVNKGVVSQQIPGDGTDLKTLLEVFKEQGKSTGLVTTDTITAATPAAFGAHEASRNRVGEIAADYFRDSKPNVLFGSDDADLGPQAKEAGYTIVTDVTSMQAAAQQQHSAQSHVFAGFPNYNNLGFQDTELAKFAAFGVYDWGTMALESDEIVAQLMGTPLPHAEQGIPHLSQMSEAALDILGQNQDGFFLMIESAQIDIQSHGASMNDWGVPKYLSRAVADVVTGISVIDMETVELDRTVQRVVDWLDARDLLGETLIVVLADHETGGMVVTADNGAGQHPEVKLTSTSYNFGSYLVWEHTAANVPVYAIGRNATLFGSDSSFGKQVLDNTEIFDRVLSSQAAFAKPQLA